MRILLFTKMFPRIGNDSFGSYVYDQVHAMIQLGHDVHVVSPHLFVPKICGVLGGKLKTYSDAPYQYNYRELAVISPPCIWARNIICNPELKYQIFKISVIKAYIKECRRYQPDIIYALDPTMEGRLAAELKNYLNVPVFLIEHSMPKFYNDLYGEGKYEHIYKHVAKCVDGMIYVSKPQKVQFERITGIDVKSFVVLNGFVTEDVTEFRKLLSSETIRLICIGYLEERKGYPVLLKTVKKLKETSKNKYSLTIIGDGLNRNDYEQTAVRYGISELITFKGIVSHQEVFRSLCNSDIFVLPSYGEALGISYLEAMNCGLPIIGTTQEGISDIIESGINGMLVDQGDTDGLYQAIEDYVENPDQTEKIAKRGKNTVKNLTWENNAKAMIDIFAAIDE